MSLKQESSLSNSAKDLPSHRELFFQSNPETTETLSRKVMSKQASRPKPRVVNRIVDLVFPDTAHTHEDMCRRRGVLWTDVADTAEGPGCQKSS